MKTNTNKILLLIMALVAVSLQSCLKDKCEGEYTYVTYEPAYISYDQLRTAVTSESPRPLQHPGKIWFSNNYIFINEKDKGIHVINNANPSSPVNEAFINIPGNIDLAVRGNTLFADSYVDLIALDISNPSSVNITHRIENALPQRGSAGFGNGIWEFQQTNPNGVITHYNEVKHTEPYELDCNGNVRNDGMFFEGDVLTNMPTGAPVFDAATGAPVNTVANGLNSSDVGSRGGSMARFALGPNYLYIVDNSTMHLYNISTPTTPTFSSQVQVGWDIETIFMYRSYLFLGSMSGMHIYDNSNPTNPVWVSTYSHINSCDPVVVEGNYAYVTLRSGTQCDGFTNQLDVVDISDITNPTLAASYEMTNPHGLGIEAGTLFICDGAAGLKVFDASNPLNIGNNQLQSFPGVHAYDVIPFQKRLFMIGDNGFYQYDYSNPNNLVLLSTITVQ